MTEIKGIVKWFKERHIRLAQNQLKSGLIDFSKTYLIRYRTLIGEIKGNAKLDLDKYAYLKKSKQNILGRFFWPNTYTVFCEVSSVKISKEAKSAIDYYTRLKKGIKNISKKEERGLFLYSQGRNHFMIDKMLCDLWDSIKQKISLLKSEIKNTDKS